MAITDENGVFTFYLAKSVTAFQMQSRARNVTDNGETYAIPAATFPTFYVEYPDDVSTQDIPGYELNLGKLDRKSTSLNSSHVAISYDVFCLKIYITIYISHT